MKRRRIARDAPALGLTIHEASGLPGLGLFEWQTDNPDQLATRILIAKRLGWVGKNITFLHEVLHAVDHFMIRQGIRKRRISHAWIENASMNLLLVLVLTGKWKDVSEAEMMRFYRNYRPKRHRRCG